MPPSVPTRRPVAIASTRDGRTADAPLAAVVRHQGRALRIAAIGGHRPPGRQGRSYRILPSRMAACSTVPTTWPRRAISSGVVTTMSLLTGMTFGPLSRPGAYRRPLPSPQAGRRRSTRWLIRGTESRRATPANVGKIRWLPLLGDECRSFVKGWRMTQIHHLIGDAVEFRS